MQQRSEEWLELRRTKIGASDAPCIMGVGFKTPLQLWEQKLGLVEPDPINPAMQRGIDLEPRILEMFNHRMGKHFAPMVRINERQSWMMASLDGYCLETNEIVEIKAGNRADHEQSKHGFVPAKYYPQLQHQMEVFDVDYCYYCSYYEDEISITRVERNRKYVDTLIKAELEFLACMSSGEPPALTDRDYVDLPTDVEQLVLELRRTMVARRELDQRETELKNHLLALVDRPSKGFGLRVTKCVRKGSINYDAIPQLAGVDLNEFRKPAMSYWTIGIEK